MSVICWILCDQDGTTTNEKWNGRIIIHVNGEPVARRSIVMHSGILETRI